MPEFVPEIIRSRRASISIHITSQGKVVVKAPHLIPNFVINNFINEKSSWIENALKKINARKPLKRSYEEGDIFYYLGEKFALEFYAGIEIVPKSGKLLFPKAITFRIKKELNDWFLSQAKKKIMDRLTLKAKEMDAEFREVRFSDTSSKWGTCFPDNSLQFNWRLIMAPLMVLDYVVIHELAHTTEKNHGDSFWRKVRQFTPAYRQHRKWLNDNAHLLTI
ncbi:MAG TPA: SprT family zinc-dependent metalloprotease [Patescibacteria group bacterium]